MSIEQQIVEWASSRPARQRAVLRRVAAGEMLTANDYQVIADKLCDGSWDTEEDFKVEHMPTGNGGGAAVSLL